MPEKMETTHEAGVLGLGRPVKRRRAVRACLSCRSRKVRCDVSRNGPPCMNCSLDGIGCVVKARKPKSSARHVDQSDTREEQQSSASPEQGVEDPPESSARIEAYDFGASLDVSGPGHLTAYEDALGHTGTIEDQVMDLMFSQDADFSLTQTTAASYEDAVFGDPASTIHNNWMADCIHHQETELTDNSRVELPCTHRRRTTHKNSVVYTYYPFVALENLHNCSQHDAEFLEAEGCFHLPTRKIMDQIVREYFLHVHPLLPILNEGDFWRMYYNKLSNGSSTMSLLVLQAMMFVSCNFVNWSPESTRSVGFKNTRGLRATFYRRAKLLYDFGADSSPVAIAQAALLLSFWTSPVNTELRSNTVWLSIAIENAKNAEAPYYATLPACQRPASAEDRLEAKQNNVLKRLWWCCVIRDRILPLGLRRGIQITRAHFDFGKHQPLGLMDLDDEVHRSNVYNADAKRELIRVLSQVLDLCVILTDVLLLVFPLDGALGARGVSTIHPLQETQIRNNKKALVHWYTAAIATSATASDDGTEITWNKHESVILYTHLMFTYYHSARMALYNHELQHYLALAADNSPVDNHKLTETRDAIQNACSNITENIRGLNQRHLTRWLPISAVAYVAFPLALHVLNNHLSASSTPGHHLHPGHQAPSSGTLIEVMMTMHSQYDGVHWVAMLVRHLVDLVQNDTALANVANWAELLTFQPRTYLRLALAMDLSMSSGRIPDNKHFPARLNVNVLQSRTGTASAQPGEGTHASAEARRDAEGGGAVEDAVLDADFFDMDVHNPLLDADGYEEAQTHQVGAGDQGFAGSHPSSEDAARDVDQPHQGDFDSEIDLGQMGSLGDGMDSFFDPVLADLAGAEAVSATGEDARAFGAEFDHTMAP